MLRTDISIHLECKLPLAMVNVNSIIALGEKSQLNKLLVEKLLNTYQQQLLDKCLGRKYRTSLNIQHLFSCPHCNNTTFVRRGSRKRALTCSLGRLNFRLYQTTCLSCKATFSPFTKVIGLNPRQRIAEELEHKLIELAKDLSYQQSANKLNRLISVKLSGFTVHRIVQRRSNRLNFHTSVNPEIIVMDSTKVKASDKKYHDDLNLAIGITSRYKKSNRFYNEKRLLALNCASPWNRLEDYLQSKRPSYVLFDGEPAIVKLSERLFPLAAKQWCIWHVPRIVFKKTLWIDRLDYRKRTPWINRLKSILYDYSSPTTILKEQLDLYIKDLSSSRLEETARYLKDNHEYFFSYKSQQADLVRERFHFDKPLVASGVIERLMREIKRRVKNGVRWTYAGVVNILKIKLIAEYNHEQYSAIWNFEKEQALIKNLKCLNVKIT